MIDKSQFLEAISVINKLSPINFSDKCAAKRPVNESLTGIFKGPLTAQFYLLFLIGPLTSRYQFLYSLSTFSFLSNVAEGS